jgi:hypothetical protein
MEQEARKVQRKLGFGLMVGGLLAFGSGAHAQGYFPFDEIPGLDSEPTVQIDLDPELMKLFGSAAKGADAEVASVFAGITNVRVRVYEGIADGAQAGLISFVEDTSRRLERDGWKSVVRVNEDGERVRIFMKLAAGGANAGKIEGITLMVVDSGSGDEDSGSSNEAVFINVAGDIEPERLGKVAAQMGMSDVFDMIPGAQNGSNKGPAQD